MLLISKPRLTIGILITNILLSGCASKQSASYDVDPIEPLNRKIYTFNVLIDGMYVRPISKGYETVVPEPMRDGVGSAIDTVKELPSAMNNALQGNKKGFAASTSRFLINTGLGFFGLFDVASAMGIESKKQEFGHTLAAWGWRDSAYIMLPLIGPSTIRDTVGMVPDYYATYPYYLDPRIYNTYTAAVLVHNRAELIGVESVITAAGVDKYALVRNAYLQKRRYEFNHENPNANRKDASGVDYLGDPPE